MNTPNENLIPATHMRQRRAYPPLSPAQLAMPEPINQEQRQDLLKRVLRAAEPKTFAEYQQWLQDWRQAHKQEVELAQAARRANTLYKLAGGYGRHEKNSPYYANVNQVEMVSGMADKNLGGEGAAYGNRVALLALRIAWKPIGKVLWAARGG